jgi:hypothetical protein
MAGHAILNSRFAKLLANADTEMSDGSRRTLVFCYAKLYQDVYWFGQLESVFSFLERSDLNPLGLPDERPAVVLDVEYAMGEFLESLNYVATALRRLLDERHMTQADALDCIGLVWDARACQERLAGFRKREDRILCGLVASITGTNRG